MSATATTQVADAYGSRLELEGETLRIEAKGHMGKAALGTAERVIEISDIRAITFESAGRLKNGKLEIVNGRGKTIIHIRHKQNDEVRVLYDVLCAQLPPEIVATSTEGAPLYSEKIDAWSEEVNAWIESKRDS